jgi:hypothetical protein
MSGFLLRPQLRQSKRPHSRPREAPNDGTPLPPKRLPRVISAPEEELEPISVNLSPEGVCTSCQRITLHGLLNTHKDSDELCWLSYDRELPTPCPMCRMIFDSIYRGNEIVGNIRIGLSVDDRKLEEDIYSGRQVREILVRKCYGGNADITRGGGFRIYAKPGVQIYLCTFAYLLLGLTVGRFIRFKICAGNACTIV